MLRLVDYDDIVEEAWQRLERAADEPAHPMRLLVLATVDSGGAPEARLMVLRGASRRLGKLWIYTDARSQKVDQLRERPAVALVAWDGACGVQLRVRGNATVCGTGPAADTHWNHAAMAVRALFSAPDAPGRPLRLPDPRLMSVKRSLDEGQEAEARGNFAVLEIAVRSIEWLQIMDGEQRRAITHASTAWAVHPLAP